jgi:rhodanese-related sulfurtransferase
MNESFQDIEITPAEVSALVRAGSNPQLVDVREDWEWEYAHIEGATHLPLDQVEFRHGSALEAGRPLVLYCHHGMRSFQAALWLRQNGYPEARSLSGGIARWADELDPDMPRY